MASRTGFATQKSRLETEKDIFTMPGFSNCIQSPQLKICIQLLFAEVPVSIIRLIMIALITFFKKANYKK